MNKNRQITYLLALVVLLVFNANCKTVGLPLVALPLQPPSSSLAGLFPYADFTYSYVPESYVQQINNAGGAPVLLPFDLPIPLLEKILDQTDMLLIPGGPADLISASGGTTGYQNRIHWMIEYATRRNDQGKYYPVYATCLGFENMIISFANQNTTVLQSRSIQLIPGAIDKTRFYKAYDQESLKSFFDSGFVFYNHNFGILKRHFDSNPLLRDAFTVVGYTKKDDIEDEFVASVEHVKYPFVANQWHPEKAPNEKGRQYNFVDRSKKTIALMNSFVKSMVDTVRESSKPLAEYSSLLTSYLAWNTDPVMSGMIGNDRVYVAPRVTFDEEFEDEM